MDQSHFLYINLTSAVCCLLFLIFLFITYFTKKNMNNIENLIYRHMLIDNAICILTYIISYSLFIYGSLNTITPTYNTICVFVAELAPVCMASWCLLMVYYLTLLISEGNEKRYNFLTKNVKYILTGIYLVSIISFLLTFFLENKTFNYNTGIETSPLIFISLILYATFIFLFIFIPLKARKVSKKKKLPLYLIVLISFIAIIIGFLNVPVVIMFAMITVINHLMYHTIENPDMKMVAELTLAKEQADRANNAKSDFLASMSHELRTPLNSIIGLTEVMTDSNDLNEIHEDLKDISVSSRKLLELVDGILTINTLESNDVQIINNNYNIKDLIKDIDNGVSLRIGDKPIEFRQNISNNLPIELYGDKDKVKTIINNLLSNAIKYTDQGVVELSVDSMVVKEKCNLRITVTDTGKGIKDEELENIFTKFYRSQENKDSDISGTGLGLSITKSLVELMDGKITVNSSEDMGTTFTVTIVQGLVENSSNNTINTEVKTVDNSVVTVVLTENNSNNNVDNAVVNTVEDTSVDNNTINSIENDVDTTEIL